MITAEQRNEFPTRIQTLFTNSKEILLTGSKYICPASMPKDVDIMLLVDNIENFIKNNSLVLDGDQTCYGDDLMVSCREGIYNILVTHNEQYFLKWKYATVIATALDLSDKQDRKTLFKMICDNHNVEIKPALDWI